MTDLKQRALEAALHLQVTAPCPHGQALGLSDCQLCIAAAMLEFAAMTHRENTDADFLEEYADELEGK